MNLKRNCNYRILNCLYYKNVSCGIIIFNNKILISQRSEKKKEYPLYWEFTGGKFEESESVDQCIVREIKEELNLNVEFNKVLYTKIHKNYRLYYCLCRCLSIDSIMINYEVNDYKLVSYDELLEMDLIPGDLEIIKELKSIIIKELI
tara:strand:- start:305 stop:748 length:444 start_codon:yes stop_codon:yes gene_type:complete